MDGQRWNEVYQHFKIPNRTYLCVWTYSKSGQEKNVYFARDDFVRALDYYARMVEAEPIKSVVMTAYRVKAKAPPLVNCLNRSNWADESVTFLSWDESD